MLSIGKLAAGRARYYLEQAEERADVVESVGAGLADYCSGGAEMRGGWIGIGARGLGLTGAGRDCPARGPRWPRSLDWGAAA